MNYVLSRLLPFVIASASGIKTSTTADSIVSYAAGIAAAVVALAVIFFIAKNAWQYIHGSGSVSAWKIFGIVIMLCFMIGLIFLAVNYKSIGNSASEIGNKALETINTEAGNILP